VLAVAGVAHPQRFFDALKQANWTIVDTMAFADHHRYSAKDIEAIETRRRSSGAGAVFTTDKDAVRLEGLSLSFPLYRVPLVVQFDPPDSLFAAVMSAVRR
jgi:tetraacyldisaccharide 4'-kinase